MFDGKISFLRASVRGSVVVRPHASLKDEERHFDRVLNVRHLPDIGALAPEKNFEMERFLEIRDSKECREFRSWLRTTRFDSDEEIARQIDTVRARLAPFIHGGGGKAVRVAVSTLAGLIPGVSILTGLAFGVVDAFVVEKLFPISGPILVISRQYPSLFKTPSNEPS